MKLDLIITETGRSLSLKVYNSCKKKILVRTDAILSIQITFDPRRTEQTTLLRSRYHRTHFLRKKKKKRKIDFPVQLRVVQLLVETRNCIHAPSYRCNYFACGARTHSLSLSLARTRSRLVKHIIYARVAHQRVGSLMDSAAARRCAWAWCTF